MSRYRGAAVFLATLFTLIALGLALYLLVPRRDLGEVETHVLDGMLATMDGVLQRCGLTGGLGVEPLQAWNWLGGTAVVFLVLALLHQRASRR